MSREARLFILKLLSSQTNYYLFHMFIVNPQVFEDFDVIVLRAERNESKSLFVEIPSILYKYNYFITAF